MDVEKLVQTMIGVAKAAAPLIGKGAPEAIALGEQVIEMVDNIRERVVTNNLDDLVAARDALERRVNANIDRTVAKLRGE